MMIILRSILRIAELELKIRKLQPNGMEMTCGTSCVAYVETTTACP